MSLLIGDIYNLSGKSMKSVQIHDRVNGIINVMENKYIDDSFCNVCPVMIKRYFNIQEIEYIINEFIPSLTYRVRGFYFVHP